MLEGNENGITVEELVIEIKAGKMDCFEPLFYRFYPLVKRYMKDYYLRYVEYDDLLQEARLVMLDAIEKYDATKGMKFSGYYRLTLQHYIYGIIRKESAIKRMSDRHATSFDELIETSPIAQLNFIDYQTPEYILVLRETYQAYSALLSKFEREVYVLYMRGLSSDAIAAELSIETVKVKNALERCRQKFNLI